MITPLEVQTKEFPKALRGYNENEVDEFLNEVMVTLENYIKRKRRTTRKGNTFRKRKQKIFSNRKDFIRYLGCC